MAADPGFFTEFEVAIRSASSGSSTSYHLQLADSPAAKLNRWLRAQG